MLKVTIGLPIYNAEKFLKFAIDSILCQTYTNIELLVVNDGSTDNSMAIVQSYQDDRIRIINDGFNKGLPFRLNQIAREASGFYLARMDSDDIMLPNRIANQVKTLENNLDIDVLGTNAYTIDENNLVQGIRYDNKNKTELIKVSGFIHPSIIAKKEWFLSNPYDEKALRIEDKDLWFRTSKKYNFKMTTEPLLFYREFGSNYYKKYLKEFNAIFYVIKKNNFQISQILFFCKYIFTGIVFYVFNLFGKESVLLQKRNQVKFKSVTLEAFFETINTKK